MKTILSTRREILGFGLASLGVFAAGGALTGVAEAKADDKAQQIADHFSQIQTMTGEFVQFGPRGEQTGGKFFIQRPGKIRFNYEGKTGFRVVADGRSVLIANQQMKTSEIYPLNKTPLKLLLDDRIDLSGNKVKSFKEEGDLTTIQLADKSVFGNARLTMMFDPKSYELRQWTITDAQGKDTTVMIFNVQQDVKLDSKIFHIDYVAVKNKNGAEMR